MIGPYKSDACLGQSLHKEAGVSLAMEQKLPYPSTYNDAEEFVAALLAFITSSDMLQSLCGSVHILDFLTRDPDLYETILPLDWREWLRLHDVMDILDLLMREEIDSLLAVRSSDAQRRDSTSSEAVDIKGYPSWRGGPLPPESLLRYIYSIRNHTLDRSFPPESKGAGVTKSKSLPIHVSVGMKPKKAHEVQNFAEFVNGLISHVAQASNYAITHVIDLGAGQNYLGRALASPPYNRQVIAVESKQLNIDGALGMDITAKLAAKKKVMRNKKAYRAGAVTPDIELLSSASDARVTEGIIAQTTQREHHLPSAGVQHGPPGQLSTQSEVGGRIEYVEHSIQDGDLSYLGSKIGFKERRKDIYEPGRTRTCSMVERNEFAHGVNLRSKASESCHSHSNDITSEPHLMVISLHSCGNLLHHGVRSIVLNPSVKAVAMVGCCYNLVTERLAPPTYKHPALRPLNQMDGISALPDPHGFPMSERLAKYGHERGNGIRLNINSRMMAVQAPQNWTKADCDAFFTRHFYRALLQRIFLDRNIVQKPLLHDDDIGSGSPRGWSGGGHAIMIGSLRKACYSSFTSYLRGAVAKLAQDSERGSFIARRMESLTDEDIIEYEERYESKKKELSIVWSFMAFSASVVESVIVVDRWLYLKEQKEVRDCWVQTVFDYKLSPRNLVVVGVKE
ncbi:hypothetical protein MMC24_006495 [Lignoscripta atroalba]|nr:hypothetical protein [Lignoscripta atroalba]